MNPSALNTLLELRGHVSIAHHVRGRIRLRIAPTLTHRFGRADRDRVQQALHSVHGIRAVRVNPAAGSVVVEYAADAIAPDTWGILLHGDPDEARRRLETLLGPTVTPCASPSEAAPNPSPEQERS